MKTSIWGPSAWRFLHAVTFAYPEQPTEEHKQAAKNLFESLRYLLPCGECCNHYCGGLDRHSIEPHLDSRASLSKWLHAMHNRVNARLGKPEYSYEQALLDFEVDDESCIVQQSCGEDSKLVNAQQEAKREAKHKSNHWIAFLFALSVILVSVIVIAGLVKSQNK